MKMLLEIEIEYRKFRKALGKIAVEAHENPYEVLCNYLEVTLAEEKANYKKAAEKVNDLGATLAKALGVELKDIQTMEIGPNELKKILDALEKQDDEIDI